MGLAIRSASVFDSSALLAFLKGEPGGTVAGDLLADRRSDRLVHAVNLCEVYYHFLRAEDERMARTALADLAGIGLRIREDMDAPFWQDVARIKADVQRVALGDCFLIALARRVDGRAVTADRAEFEPVATRRICEVVFIR